MSARVFVGAAPFSPSAPPEHRGGLYRLSEGASGWDTLTVGLPPNPAVRAVVIDPRDRDVIFAGAQDGPYRSRDGGDSWERLDFPSPGLAVWPFAFDPGDPDTMYLGTGPALLFRSRDGGDTWVSLVVLIVVRTRRGLALPAYATLGPWICFQSSWSSGSKRAMTGASRLMRR